MSQRLILKVLFFDLHRRSLGFVSESLIDVLNVHDNTEAGSNFEKLISIMSLIILESKALIRLLLSLIVDENMVSSEEEFFRIMERMQMKDKIGSTIGATTLNKLCLAARKYNNKNRMNELLNSFFAHLKEEAIIFQGENGRLRKRFTRLRTYLADQFQKFGANNNWNKNEYSLYRRKQVKNNEAARASQTMVLDGAPGPAAELQMTADALLTPVNECANASETEDINQHLDLWDLQTQPVPNFEETIEDLKGVANGIQYDQPRHKQTQIRKIGTSDKIRRAFQARRKKFKEKHIMADNHFLQPNKDALIEENEASIKQKSSFSFRRRFRSNQRVPQQSYARSVSMGFGKPRPVSSEQLHQQQPQNQPQSKFATIRKFKQYISRLSGKQPVQSWQRLGIEGNSGQAFRGPMAISKQLIVGMKFQRPNKARKAQSLSNLVSEIVQLEYLSKVAKGQASEDIKLTLEMNMVKPWLHAPTKVEDGTKPGKRSGVATPSTASTSAVSNNRRASSYELLDRTKKRVLTRIPYE